MKKLILSLCAVMLVGSVAVLASHAGQMSVRMFLPLMTNQMGNNTALLESEIIEEETGILRDAREYADAMGVSQEEALERLGYQETIGELDAELTRETTNNFGGLYIQHEPEFQVVILLTEGSQSEARSSRSKTGSYISDSDLPSELITIQEAKYTLEELKRFQDIIQQANTSQDIPVETSVNVYKNTVDVFTVEDNLRRNKTSVAIPSNAVPSDVANIVAVESLSRPAADIFGGKHLSTCTAGFSVVADDGTRGVTTAAHCPDSQSFEGTSLPMEDEKWETQYDIQWHTTPGFDVKNKAYDGRNNREITSSASTNSHSIGKWVCKYGKTTGYGCGQIKSNTHNPTYCNISNSTASFVRVKRFRTDLSSPGDSGGPWMYGSHAYGSMSCYFRVLWGSDQGIYMPIDRVSILGGGLDVLTSP